MILRQDLLGSVSKLNGAAEFFPTSYSLRFYPKILLNLFLQLINACLYSRVFNPSVLSPSLRFSLISTNFSLEMGLLSDRTLLDFGMALSTAVLIADTIKSAYLSKSLVDVVQKSPRNLAQPRVLIRILLCQSGQICTWCG